MNEHPRDPNPSSFSLQPSAFPHRPRRNRRTPAIRALVRETTLTPGHLIYPLFVHDAPANQPIDAMPGCERHTLDSLLTEAAQAHALGIRALALFPAIDAELKTADAAESHNPRGLIPRAVQRLKAELPEIAVITDVALDPYSSMGHDGLVQHGEIANDPSVEVLCKQALAHARAGADIVAPSDMMDGRVAAIRRSLDAEGFTNVGIMAYTAKYASALYGPFREALDSAPVTSGETSGGGIPTDKKTYQMDYANAREARREAWLDESEGADILMVKPASLYLDVIHDLRAVTTLPMAAYHVSGEYAMIQAAAQRGWLDERAAAMETLTAIHRAGADMILTYFAKKAAQWLSAPA